MIIEKILIRQLHCIEDLFDQVHLIEKRFDHFLERVQGIPNAKACLGPYKC
jgi:hypothetical protein